MEEDRDLGWRFFKRSDNCSSQKARFVAARFSLRRDGERVESEAKVARHSGGARSMFIFFAVVVYVVQLGPRHPFRMT
jgi:hypothetical protein